MPDRRARGLLPLLGLLLALALPATAQGQTYTTIFGGTGTSSSAQGFRLKANLYTPSVDCVLASARFWAGSTGTLSVGVWEQQGSSYVSVFQGTISPGTTTKDWRNVPNMNVPMTAGTQYVVALHWSSSTTGYYSFSSSGSFPSVAWGGMSSWKDVITQPTGFPSTFSSSVVSSGTTSGGGYRQELTVVVNSDSDNDGWTTDDGDCDDDDPFIFPGATELCDGLDGDCNGVLPADEADADFDGVLECEGDCDDFDSFTYPSAPELCDGVDNDCDAAVDEGISPDVDGDGYSAFGSCLGTADDCDDSQASVNPGATEVCDGLDNDCNGSTDEGLSEDADSDGATSIGSCLGSADDCDDADPFTYPGATELCDGTDNNCDGSLLSDEGDADSDGYLGCADDCDDGDADVNPGVAEDCDNNVDDNCNGAIDEAIDGDGDGYDTCEDCDDGDADVNPGASEGECDGVDTDCDGDLHPMELDGDGDGQTGCDGDCDDEDADTYTGATEICDGLDNDCDGDVPEEEADCGGDDDDAGDDDDDDDDGGGRGGGGRRSACSMSDGEPSAVWLGLALLGVVGAASGRRRSRG